jgi:hypothetical protein
MRRYFVVALIACAAFATPAMSQAFPSGATAPSCTNDVYVMGSRPISVAGGWSTIPSQSSGFSGGLAVNVTAPARQNIVPEVYGQYNGYNNTAGGHNTYAWDAGLSGRVFLNQDEKTCGANAGAGFVGAGVGYSSVYLTTPTGNLRGSDIGGKLFVGVMFKGGFEVRGTYTWRPKVIDALGNSTEFSGPTVSAGVHF